MVTFFAVELGSTCHIVITAAHGLAAAAAAAGRSTGRKLVVITGSLVGARLCYGDNSDRSVRTRIIRPFAFRVVSD